MGVQKRLASGEMFKRNRIIIALLSYFTNKYNISISAAVSSTTFLGDIVGANVYSNI
jgi:hypothetical protein